MVKNSSSHSWKPIQLDEAFLNTDIDGLVGIEECTDYDSSQIISNRNLKKRKLTSSKERDTKNNHKKPKTKLVKKDSAQPKDTEDLSPSKEGSTDTYVISNTQVNYEENVFAWKQFGLPDSILKAIGELGFEKPTTIQELTLPPAILGKRDILGAAETGSGKTLAFGLPILTGILNIKEQNPDNDTTIKPLYALILTPTRELAVQIKNHLTAIAKYTGIRIAVVLGGMAAVKQERILGKGPEIVVATPGRLWELIQEGNAHLAQINDISFLAIDETDRMLEKGHFHELYNLLERMNMDEVKCKERQNFVFSATLILVHELPKHLAMRKKLKSRNSKKINIKTPQQKVQEIIDILGISDPKIVDITQTSGTAETLVESRIACPIEEKDYYVYYFLQRHPGRTLIFCNSIGCVKRLTTLLGLLQCHPLPLHASMQQKQRLKNLERFRDNEYGVLVATDVAARGLDIPFVEHVLHYQTPRTAECYVHRSGRTARASREGLTLCLIEPNESPNYLRLCRTLGKTEDLPLFPVDNNLLNSIKERVKVARDLDKCQLQVKRANTETGWIEKAAQEMDILVDDNKFTNKYDQDDINKFKKLANIRSKQLMQLLSKSLIPKGFSGKYPLFSNSESLLQSFEQKDKALDAVKNVLSSNVKPARRKAKWLFKSKLQSTNAKEKIVVSKLKSNTKNKKNIKNKKLKKP